MAGDGWAHRRAAGQAAATRHTAAAGHAAAEPLAGLATPWPCCDIVRAAPFPSLLCSSDHYRSRSGMHRRELRLYRWSPPPTADSLCNLEISEPSQFPNFAFNCSQVSHL